MGLTVAITGKGGVGKTTLAAMAVRWLGEQGLAPVLAVDADPNSCLDVLLGVHATTSVGGVREEAKRIAQEASSGGMGKHELLDLKIQEALIESTCFDLIAMGRPEGPGCYCYANNVLRQVLARLAQNYPAVVIDNEAGLENLSRRTVQTADWLLFVADPSQRGLLTARRLVILAEEMQINAHSRGVVLNRFRDPVTLTRARDVFDGSGVEVLGQVSEDDEIAANDAVGGPVFSLSPGNRAYTEFSEIMKQITRKK